MPDAPSPSLPDSLAADRLAQLEVRLARIETHLGLAASPAEIAPAPSSPAVERGAPPAAVASTAGAATQQAADELELEVGQTWFARVGILVFALGGGFMLTLPYPGLNAAVPSLIGLAAAAVLFFIAHRWENSFELVTSYLRGAGMALLFCAILRLFFFSTPPALSIESPFAPALLGLAVAFNLAVALHRNSPWLTGLALITG